MRGRPLAIRLAALLAAAVLVVLLLAGIVVNRATTQTLEDAIGPGDRQRLALAAAIVEEGLERSDPRMRRLLDRIAAEAGGEVRVVDAGGSVRFEAGRRPPGRDTDLLTVPLSADAGGGELQVRVPSTRAPFLRAFNAALIGTGLAALGVLLVVALLASRRMTRPLQAVAEAAHRLGAGDLSARAPGGPDAESAELAVAFNGMADRLERSEALRRRAASDLAHDLATPATVLESQLQAMVDGVVPADAAQLERARAAATALSGVIVQLGELTQAEAAPLQRHPEPIELRAMATELVAALGGLLRDRQVRAAIEGVDAVVVADRGQLERAVRNVVTNAAQHTPAGGRIRADVSVEGPLAVLRVTDAGPGIATDDLPYVFERFYRADRARGTERPGSGIGLTVARELVTANGGSIEVETTGSAGTTFRIALPLRTSRPTMGA
ncbi:MAG TPA: HAMP domain-containing sensor histidine kinase [Candidatus Limnocylindria bacterium]